MVVINACKLNLPPPNLRPSLDVTSLLFDISSNTLALMHSDSSILLLPSISPFTTTTPSSQTLIPPFSTSSTFVRLQSSPNSPTSQTIFIAAGPRHGDSRVLLRFYILSRSNSFVRGRVRCSQRGFVCDDRIGVLVDLNHGVSVKVVGGLNVFVVHSVSARKIWVFGVKMVGKEEVKLVKCAVIDCTVPICSIAVSSGFLFLGEGNGVRGFALRGIVKGRVKNQSDFAKKNKKNAVQNRKGCLGNGACCGKNGENCNSKCLDSDHTGIVTAMDESVEKSSNGYAGKVETNNASSKPRTVKLKQDSSVAGTFFVEFNGQEPPNQKFSKIKVVSVQSLSPKKFLVLDSDGDLHFLGLSMLPGSEITVHMRHLTHTMKVRMLAVHPDISTRTQTFWISDGFNSVHVMLVSENEVSVNENDESESEEKQLQISAIEAMFASEKILDLIPFSANGILILEQGNIFAYAIS